MTNTYSFYNSEKLLQTTEQGLKGATTDLVFPLMCPFFLPASHLGTLVGSANRAKASAVATRAGLWFWH